MKSWHLRMAITSQCNYQCKYCSTLHPNDYIPIHEMRDILSAAYDSSIKRVHWTGGEPTCHPELLSAINLAAEMGYEEQVISTNGSSPQSYFEKLIANGIDRFNISLDTLNPHHYYELTGRDCLQSVLKNIDMAVRAEKLVKINCVVMKKNLPEIPEIIRYFSTYNTERRDNIILRLIQFYPSNPNQLDKNGQNYWKEQYVHHSEILEMIGNHYEDHMYTRGDNPSFKYFRLKNHNLKVGILSMFSWNYVCGGCLKLRITPLGQASVCLSDDKIYTLSGKTLSEKADIIQEAMARRLNYLDPIPRQHFRSQLGMLRFGSDGNKVKISDFLEILGDKG